MERHGLQRKYKAGALSPTLRRRGFFHRRLTKPSGAVVHCSPRQAATPVEAISTYGELQAGIPVEGLIGRVGRD